MESVTSDIINSVDDGMLTSTVCVKEEPVWTGFREYANIKMELEAVPEPEDIVSRTQYSPPKVKMVIIKQEPLPESPKSDPSGDGGAYEVTVEVEVKLEPKSEAQETFVSQNPPVEDVNQNQISTELPSQNLPHNESYGKLLMKAPKVITVTFVTKNTQINHI